MPLPAGGSTTMNYLGEMDGVPFVDVANPANARMALQPCTIAVTDARPLAGELSLDRQGFTLVTHQSRLRPEDFANAGHVESVYLREMERVVQDVTGADLVISARQPLVRLNRPEDGSGKYVRPAPLAHSDYTQFTLDRQLGYEAPLEAPAFSAFKRVVAYQTWRALSPPPQDNTLMFCDAATVAIADRVRSEFVTPPPYAETLEFYMYRYNPQHRWYYFPDLQFGELLLFKGFEGDEPGKLNVLHGAADIPGVAGPCVPRESIETRAFAFFRD